MVLVLENYSLELTYKLHFYQKKNYRISQVQVYSIEMKEFSSAYRIIEGISIALNDFTESFIYYIYLP